MQRLISPRIAGSAAIIGLAAVAAVWVGTYREAHPAIGLVVRGQHMPTTYTAAPAWATPLAAAIGIAAVAVTALVLRRR